MGSSCGVGRLHKICDKPINGPCSAFGIRAGPIPCKGNIIRCQEHYKLEEILLMSMFARFTCDIYGLTSYHDRVPRVTVITCSDIPTNVTGG